MLAEARTPAYRTVGNRGAGTDAANRLSSESGSMFTATVPSAKGFFERYPHEPVRPARDPFLRDRGPQDVLEQRLPALHVHSPRRWLHGA